MSLGPKSIAFSLDINAIETENIFVDHTVNAPVTRFAKLL